MTQLKDAAKHMTEMRQHTSSNLTQEKYGPKTRILQEGRNVPNVFIHGYKQFSFIMSS